MPCVPTAVIHEKPPARVIGKWLVTRCRHIQRWVERVRHGGCDGKAELTAHETPALGGTTSRRAESRATRDRTFFMSTTFRDATIVVIETSRDAVRAVHGINELLQKPSVVCAHKRG